MLKLFQLRSGTFFITSRHFGEKLTLNHWRRTDRQKTNKSAMIYDGQLQPDRHFRRNTGASKRVKVWLEKWLLIDYEPDFLLQLSHLRRIQSFVLSGHIKVDIRKWILHGVSCCCCRMAEFVEMRTVYTSMDAVQTVEAYTCLCKW